MAELTYDAIALRALSLFVKRLGSTDGNYYEVHNDDERYQLSLQDWYAAETELANDSGGTMPDPQTTVQPPNEPEPQSQAGDQPETVQPASDPAPQQDVRPEADVQAIPAPATVTVQP